MEGFGFTQSVDNIDHKGENPRSILFIEVDLEPNKTHTIVDMTREENSDSIPNDLIIDVLSRLPVKSIGRCRCVSEQWRSMLNSPDFTKLFLTRPPRLFFAVDLDDQNGEWNFFSSLQPQILYDEKKSSSLVVTADFHMKVPGEYSTFMEFYGHASGLACFHRRMASEHKNQKNQDKNRDKNQDRVVICNPSTGQYASLPSPKGDSFLGFDPIDKQFKVLSISFPYYGRKVEPDLVLTLGGKHSWWRKIHCPLKHSYSGDGICINGVLYYLAKGIHSLHYISLPYMIVCFDVRSEKFKFIYGGFIRRKYTKLINYKGKLGVITLSYDDDYPEESDDGCDTNDNSHKVSIWVINDVEKPESSEWSEYFSYRWDVDEYLSIIGMTAAGEIVLSNDPSSDKPFYVFYLNPERKSFQRVEIRGLGASTRVKVIIDHVEDLKFITISPKIDSLLLLDDDDDDDDEST